MIGSPSSGWRPTCRGSASSAKAFREAGALGFRGTLVPGLFAELDIGAEAAHAQRDFQPGFRILAQHLDPVRAAVGGGTGRHLSREITIGIVRAADECAEPAELEREPARAALRALARVAAVGARGKDVRGE